MIRQERWYIDENLLDIITYPNFKKLSKNTRHTLTKPLVALTAEAFLRFQIDREIAVDVLKHVSNAQRIKLAYLDGKPVAYIASKTYDYDGIPVYYLGGIIVNHQLKHSGLTKRLLLEELQDTNAGILALQTQNGQMLGLMKKFCQIDPFLAIRLALMITEKPRPNGIITKAAYRKGEKALYDDLNRFVNEGFEIRYPDLVSILGETQAADFDWRHGDALFVAGYITL